MIAICIQCSWVSFSKHYVQFTGVFEENSGYSACGHGLADTGLTRKSCWRADFIILLEFSELIWNRVIDELKYCDQLMMHAFVWRHGIPQLVVICSLLMYLLKHCWRSVTRQFYMHGLGRFQFIQDQLVCKFSGDEKLWSTRISLGEKPLLHEQKSCGWVIWWSSSCTCMAEYHV